MANSDVISKINNLLNKTVANGCSVEESATAAKLAQRLLTKHRLTMADLVTGDSDEEISNDFAPLYEGQRMSTWKNALALAVAKANGCKVFINTAIRYGKKNVSARLIGRESDVAVVRYFFAYLEREIDRLTKGALANGTLSGKGQSNSFRLGAVQAINERLSEGREDARQEARESGYTALVRVDNWDNEVERWAAENMRLGQTKAQRSRVDYGAYAKGQRAGRSVSLNKGIGSGAGRGVRGLPGR